MFLVAIVLPSYAQNSIGVSPLGVNHPLPSFGFEFGVGQNSQSGTYFKNYTGGTGTGWSGSLFLELPITNDVDIGLKAGYERKNITSSFTENESGTIVTNSQVDTSVQIPVNSAGMVTASFIHLEPLVQYQILHSNFFVQLGMGISSIASSNRSQTKTIANNSITLSNGTTINNLDFTNGSNAESVQNREIPGESGLRGSGIVTAGYNIIWENPAFYQMLTYEYPFSNIGSENSSNWRISTIYGSIAMKFNLQ